MMKKFNDVDILLIINKLVITRLYGQYFPRISNFAVTSIA